MDNVKSIVYTGIFQGWAYSNIIYQIMYEIANEEELDALSFWDGMDDLPELTDKAKKLYEKYREEYYQSK